MSSADLSALEAIVPPPATPLQTGGSPEWSAVQAAINISLPDDLAALSMRYGSGYFEDQGFQLRIYNPFGPLFIDRCKYLRAIRTDAGYQSSGDPWAAFLREKFEFGSRGWSHEDSEDYLMWDTSSERNTEWPIIVPTPNDWHQQFHWELIPFLLEAFSGRLRVDGFPSRFERLRFIPEAESVPGSQSA